MDAEATGAATNRPPAYWPPFTPRRGLSGPVHMFSGAQGMYYIEPGGRRVLDAIAGLWCVNAGHSRDRIVEAISRQARELDFVSSFGTVHPLALEVADRLVAIAPDGFNHVFFTNSGSESADTALKIARVYHSARGDMHRIRFIGRARGYHGMGWGGLSVSGIARQRRSFGPLLGDVAHLNDTLDVARNAFSRGRPQWGAHLADELLQLIQVYDAGTIAAVIVEPVIGSGGVVPPPVGYLERLREICSRHGILLIFDEVITGFGRLGGAFAAQAFGVTPDIITCAKGMTSGTVPMGAVLVSDKVRAAFFDNPEGPAEFLHGYTYSGHPLACAACIAALDVYRDEALFERAARLAPLWEEAAHMLKGAPHVIDIRNAGLMAVIDLAPDDAAPGRRGFEAAARCLEDGVLVRPLGDALALSPPLIVSENQIDEAFATARSALDAIA